MGSTTRDASDEERSTTAKGLEGVQEGDNPDSPADSSGGVEGGETADVCENSPHGRHRKRKSEVGVATEKNVSSTPPQKHVMRKGLVAMVTPPAEYHPLQIKRVVVRPKKKKRLTSPV